MSYRRLLTSFVGLLAALALVWLAGPATVQAGWPPAPRLAVPEDDEVGFLPPSITAERTESGIWQATFAYQPAAPVERVNLAGSFNSWNMGSLPMERGDDGVWRHTLKLGAGEYMYKFIENGDHWLADPRNPDAEEGGYGNSILRLGRVASLKVSESEVGDGQISVAGLLHDPAKSTYVQALGANEVLLRYRTLAHDVSQVWVVFKNGREAPLHVELQGPLFTYWQTTTEVDAYAEPMEYTFVLTDRKGKASHPTDFTTTLQAGDFFHTPDWARDAIWYQVMLDRFRNGNHDNDPPSPHPWTAEWFRPVGDEGKDGRTFYDWYVFDRLYGGDFDGLEEKLDYLKDLGVNAIYLNPIFQSHTHHKYDAQSYLHVDETFGTQRNGEYEAAIAKEDLNDPSTWVWTDADQRFLAFLRTAHSKGFRVIIDGVFNHVGDRHSAFLDVKKNKQASPYADWFEIKSWEPFEYQGWAGFSGLPVFRKDEEHGLASKQVREHIYNVTRRWMDPDGDGDPRDGIDGWRLDVPADIPAVFWENWRKHVRALNPDAYITGEIWDRAGEWLDGKHFDAVMNYEFARAAVHWIFDRKEKTTASEIDHTLAEQRLAYPAAATYVLQNLIDSHDTDRAVSMAANPDRDYDKGNRVQNDAPDYDNDKPNAECYARARLVALLQATYVGAPMIYYGDEAGMWGADDPTNRKPMLWKDLEPYEDPEDNHVMDEQLAWYREVFKLRAAHAALRRGSFETLRTDDEDDVWAFARSHNGERIIVALTPSNEPQTVRIPLPEGAAANWRIVFSGGKSGLDNEPGGEPLRAEDGTLTLKLPVIGGVVLKAQRP